MQKLNKPKQFLKEPELFINKNLITIKLKTEDKNERDLKHYNLT